MKNEEKAVKMYNGITGVGDDLIKEAGTARKRKKTASWRWGLVAACLCAALLGTAFAAANPEAVAQFIQRLTVQVEDSGYHVSGASMTKYPVNRFSPAVLKASEERESPVVTLSFSTWDETRAFLGKNIPVVWPDEGREWDAPFYVYLFHVETEQLWGIDINSTSISRQEEVCIQIRTEHWKGEGASSGLGIAEGTVEALGSYSMPNGSIAEMVKYLGTEEHPQASTMGHFMKDGILYDVTTFGTVSTEEEMTANLKAVLDSFQ